MEETFKDTSRYLRVARFSCTKCLEIPASLKKHIIHNARKHLKLQQPYRFALEIRHLVKKDHDKFLPEMLFSVVLLKILPFPLRYGSDDTPFKIKKYLEEVEPKVESEMAETEIVHKVSKSDLRLLIFNGILSRNQNWSGGSSSFKKNFMKNAEWLLKTEPLNRFIEGLFTDRCKNFRLAWKYLFGEGQFRINFGEEQDYESRMFPYKVKVGRGKYRPIFTPEGQRNWLSHLF